MGAQEIKINRRKQVSQIHKSRAVHWQRPSRPQKKLKEFAKSGQNAPTKVTLGGAVRIVGVSLTLDGEAR